jgi:hypothetical protein
MNDQDKYLFLPFAGMYNSQNEQGKGTIGSYWHNGNGNGGYSYQFASSYFTAHEGGGGHALRANTIRCVKDN